MSPLQFEFLEHYVVVKAAGQFEPVARIAALESMISGPSYRPGSGVLYDTRTAGTPPTQPQLRMFTQFLADKADVLGPFAILTAEDVHFGVGRMTSAFLETSGVECQVFRDEARAVRWLEEGSSRREPRSSGGPT